MAKHDSVYSKTPSLLFLILLLFEANHVEGAGRLNQWESGIRLPTDKDDEAEGLDEKQVGTRWAVLVAGSSGYGNYRHQVIKPLLKSKNYNSGYIYIVLFNMGQHLCKCRQMYAMPISC